jgi:hypothetical protein
VLHRAKERTVTAYYIFPVLFLVLAFVYMFWMKKNAAQGLANARPAFHAFFERTGYRYPDLEDQPVEAQVDRAYRDVEKPDPTGKLDMAYVRNYHGLRIHYSSRAWSEKKGSTTTYYRTNQWDAELPAPPRVPVHIADKGLVSLSKAAREAFSSSVRVFEPQCSQQVTTGIPTVDDRFVVYGENPDAVRQLFAQNPNLIPLLDNWAELDVAVTPSGAFFADPGSNNLQAAMGGMIANMAMGFDYGKRTELSIPVHDRVAELLATLVRATA